MPPSLFRSGRFTLEQANYQGRAALGRPALYLFGLL
jgi:hypothetical protein